MAVAMVSVPPAGQAAPAALPQAAEFYVGGLEPVYADMFTVFSLSVFCKDRFPHECGGEHPDRMALVDKDLQKLQAVTVFGHPPATDFPQSYTSPEQAGAGILELQKSFMGKALSYEKQLLTRYAAVNKVCGGGSAAETADLQMTIALNLQRFWGFDRQGYEAALVEINQQADGYMEQIHSLWSPERCTQARVLGHDLRMLLLKLQLQDYMHPGWQKFVQRDKLAQATDFIAAAIFFFDDRANPGRSR
jgi:hypothetical protein